MASAPMGFGDEQCAVVVQLDPAHHQREPAAHRAGYRLAAGPAGVAAAAAAAPW